MKIVRDYLQDERGNADRNLFKRCYSQACAVAALIDIQLTIPRVTSRQNFPAKAEPILVLLENSLLRFTRPSHTRN